MTGNRYDGETYAGAYGVYTEIARQAGSDVVLFFIILAVLLVALVPLYVMIFKDRKNNRTHENDKSKTFLEREREILAIVKENSATIAANSQIITSFKSFSETKSEEFLHAIARIHTRVDMILDDTTTIRALAEKKKGRKEGGGENND